MLQARRGREREKPIRCLWLHRCLYESIWTVSGVREKEEGGRGRNRSGVCGYTGVYTSLYGLFLVSEKRRREEEGETSGVCGDTGVYTTLYGSFPVSKRKSK